MSWPFIVVGGVHVEHYHVVCVSAIQLFDEGQGHAHYYTVYQLDSAVVEQNRIEQDRTEQSRAE